MRNITYKEKGLIYISAHLEYCVQVIPYRKNDIDTLKRI